MDSPYRLQKAGFYSYDWLDNDRIPSAERIIPEYQNLTRLRVRQERLITRLMMDALEIVMMRKCLLGIKRRVEATE